MRNIIFGAVGVLWGAGILIRARIAPLAAPTEAHAIGHSLGVLFGFLFLGAGMYALIVGIRSEMPQYTTRPKKKKRKRPRLESVDDEEIRSGQPRRRTGSGSDRRRRDDDEDAEFRPASPPKKRTRPRDDYDED
jgi:hypothetical protein